MALQGNAQAHTLPSFKPSGWQLSPHCGMVWLFMEVWLESCLSASACPTTRRRVSGASCDPKNHLLHSSCCMLRFLNAVYLTNAAPAYLTCYSFLFSFANCLFFFLNVI